MVSKRRRSSLQSALIALVVALPLFACPAEAESAPCDEARTWVDQYITDKGTLPEIEDVGSLPAHVAKEVLGRMNASEKTAFWRGHVASFLELPLQTHHSEALRNTLELINQELFERAELGGPESVRADLEQIMATLSAAFDKRDVAVIIGSTRSDSRLSAEYATNVPALESGDLPDCSCNVTWDFCMNATLCEKFIPLACESYWPGCGPLFLDYCNGQCCRPSPRGGWLCS